MDLQLLCNVRNIYMISVHQIHKDASNSRNFILILKGFLCSREQKAKKL